LALGGLAFVLNQEWFLRKYEQLGLNAILSLMFLVGVLSTSFSKAGFVGVVGSPIRTRQASYILLALVAIGLVVAQSYPAIHKGAGVAIITALALSNRVLRIWVKRTKSILHT
jgi:predicted membrane protein